jgi:hypothetical protein
MRKKIAMRKGGKVTKYADGGRVGGPRAQENRRAMAAAAAPGFDAEEDALLARRAARRNSPSMVTNNPVGTNPVRGGPPVGATRLMAEPAPYESTAQPAPDLPLPPVPPRAPPRVRQRTAMSRSRSRELSADDLNEREMTRILNDRSLEAAQNGRAPFKKGGRVKAKC